MASKEQRAIWNREWIKNNKERYAFSKYRYKDELKRKVLAHYGNGVIHCVFCGFSDIRALCLDHIEDNGAEHRKLLNISGRGHGAGSRTYEALLKAGLPIGLQILCANCNMVKEQNRHIRNRIKNSPMYEQYYNSIQL